MAEEEPGPAGGFSVKEESQLAQYWKRSMATEELRAAIGERKAAGERGAVLQWGSAR